MEEWPHTFKKRIVNPDVSIERWRHALCDFSDEIVMRASKDVLAEFKFMPSAFEMIELCRRVKPKVAAKAPSPRREPDPPEWYTLNLELTDIVKKIHYPDKKYNDLVDSKFEDKDSIVRGFRGMVCYEVGQLTNMHKRQVDCKDPIDVVGIKRAIQLANAELGARA